MRPIRGAENRRGIERALRIAAAALALSAPAAVPAAAQLDSVSVLVGQGEVLDGGSGAEGGFELGFAPGWLGLQPVLGAAAGESGSAFAYLGMRREFALGDRLTLAPFTGAALYHQGEGKDLGGAAQFRSGLELGLRLSERGRLALALYHLSNAGLSDHNPGTETLVVGYSLAPRARAVLAAAP